MTALKFVKGAKSDNSGYEGKRILERGLDPLRPKFAGENIHYFNNLMRNRVEYFSLITQSVRLKLKVSKKRAEPLMI